MNLDTLIKELQEAKVKVTEIFDFTEIPVLIRFNDEPLLPPQKGYSVDHITIVTIQEKTTTEKRIIITVG